MVRSISARRIIERLIDSGCRGAAPGEFTRRAFANGRLDLSQAEAVADLIASTSAALPRVAMNQSGRVQSGIGRFASSVVEVCFVDRTRIGF